MELGDLEVICTLGLLSSVRLAFLETISDKLRLELEQSRPKQGRAHSKPIAGPGPSTSPFLCLPCSSRKERFIDRMLFPSAPSLD